MANRHFNVVELYAGTARTVEPFRQWKRAKIALLVDKDQFAADTYLANYPKAPYLVRDLARITPDQIKERAGGKVDILLGCPPCQGYSDAGSRNLRDPRNEHISVFRHFAEKLKPMAIAMENVPLAAILGLRFKRFYNAIERLGYRSTWGMVNAALHGSAQCRHRLIYIAIRGDFGVDPVIPPPSHGGMGQYFNYSTQQMGGIEDDPTAMLSRPPGVLRAREMLYLEKEKGKLPIPTIGEVINDLPPVDSSEAKELSHFAWNHTRQMKRRMAAVPEGGRWKGGKDHFSHSYGRLHRHGLARTITTFFPNPGSGRFWHPTQERTLSIREAARLQGFPDSFRFLPESTNTTRLIGNALDASLAKLAYLAVRNSLE